mgnify:CR=1 FL=1
MPRSRSIWRRFRGTPQVMLSCIGLRFCRSIPLPGRRLVLVMITVPTLSLVPLTGACFGSARIGSDMARQHWAQSAEQVRLEANEARRLGHPALACRLDRAVLRGLTLASAGQSDSPLTWDLLTAQRDVVVCQENGL